MVKCTMCQKLLRIPMFPFNLFFWRKKAILYRFDADIEGTSFNVMTVLCPTDLDYAMKNETVAQELILARVKRLEEEI